MNPQGYPLKLSLDREHRPFSTDDYSGSQEQLNFALRVLRTSRAKIQKELRLRLQLESMLEAELVHLEKGESFWDIWHDPDGPEPEVKKTINPLLILPTVDPWIHSSAPVPVPPPSLRPPQTLVKCAPETVGTVGPIPVVDVTPDRPHSVSLQQGLATTISVTTTHYSPSEEEYRMASNKCTSRRREVLDSTDFDLRQEVEKTILRLQTKCGGQAVNVGRLWGNFNKRSIRSQFDAVLAEITVSGGDYELVSAGGRCIKCNNKEIVAEYAAKMQPWQRKSTGAPSLRSKEPAV